MGLFDFFKDKGKDVPEANRAAEIRNILTQSLGDQILNIDVTSNDGTVNLNGRVRYFATKEKATLIAGNIKGVEKVNNDGLQVDKSQNQDQGGSDAESEFYTIESGDSLSAIAGRVYGDAGAWRQIYDANREVIGDDPDKIYPGQKIRLPKKG